MRTLKVEKVLDLSLLKEDFFLEILNLITKSKGGRKCTIQKVKYILTVVITSLFLTPHNRGKVRRIR